MKRRPTKRKPETLVVREDSPAYGATPPRFIDLFCGIGGFGLVTERDIARTLSARYHKDGSEILIAQSGGHFPRRLRFAENGRAMLRKKRQLRRRGIVGKVERLSGIRAEVFGDAALR